MFSFSLNLLLNLSMQSAFSPYSFSLAVMPHSFSLVVMPCSFSLVVLPCSFAVPYSILHFCFSFHE
uniref:Uncharacterized protein n=1 Tax=Arundo donax TaxID=35708 RepID=A0A0A9HSV1_ARUDO